MSFSELSLSEVYLFSFTTLTFFDVPFHNFHFLILKSCWDLQFSLNTVGVRHREDSRGGRALHSGRQDRGGSHFSPLVFIFLFLGKVEVAYTFPLLIYITFCTGYSPTGDNIGMSPQRFAFLNINS